MNFPCLCGVNLQRLCVVVVVTVVPVEPYWPLGARRVREVARADVAQIGIRVAFL